MQKLGYAILVLILLISCKNPVHETNKVELSVAQKIANAHGYANWHKVKELRFCFNGKRDWIWHPKSNQVTFKKDTINIAYNRKTLDSATTQVDKAFINDKFWLLFPFQLVWDDGIIISDPIKTKAPISKKSVNKITLTYQGNGGYTPGDAYDIFFNENYIIEEWVFRKGNQKEATLINTFENYKDFEGIKIAQDHKNINERNVVELSKIQIKIWDSE